LFTIFFRTKNIFILNIYRNLCIFKYIHIDDRHFSDIVKLKKRTKTAQALPQRGFLPFFSTPQRLIPVKEPLSIHVCVTTLGGGGGLSRAGIGR